MCLNRPSKVESYESQMVPVGRTVTGKLLLVPALLNGRAWRKHTPLQV